MKTILFDNTRDANNQFRTGYIVSKGTKYITVEYLTNIQGDCDKTYRLTEEEWNGLNGDSADKCICISESHEPIKKGSPIQ